MSRRLSEDELIARFFAPAAGPAALGLRDDAACLTPPSGCDLVLTCDALVAGVHFFADDPPASIARKALRVNLSDLAAKGARPLGFLLSLALSSDWTEAWLAAFAAALGDDGAAYGCPLAGGDTVRTPGPLTLSIAAFGAVPTGRMAARTGVRPGDRLYVSGTLATPRSASGSARGADRTCLRPRGRSSSAATSSRSPASRWRRRWRLTPMPAWTFPTGSSAT